MSAPFFPRPPRMAWLAVALFALILLPKIGGGTLWHHDELLTANRAREMLVRGDPFAVTVNFAPSVKKPPLQYWACAALLRLLPDRPELALRLPTLLAGAGCLLAAWWLARVYYPDAGDRDLAVWAVLALAGCGYLIHFSRTALLDTGAALFLMLVLVGCRLARRDARWWWFVAAWCVLGAWQKAPFGLAAWTVLLITDRRPAGRGGWRGHLPLAFGAAVAGSFAWWIVQWMHVDRAVLYTAGREQIGNFLRAHDPADEGFRPWLYWLWMARDWTVVGVCAPVAAVVAATRAKEGRAGLGWTCVLFGVALAAVVYRAERYLVVITPVLAVLTVGFLRDAALALPLAARRWVLPVALATMIPGAAFQFLKPAPARRDLLVVARELDRTAQPEERLLVCTDADADFDEAGFVLFYANLRRPLEAVTLAAVEALAPEKGNRFRGVCSRAQWERLAKTHPGWSASLTRGDWVLWESR